ncbi:MAG: permease [Pseudanabaenaceae cyanobacterium bins.68]|nr:permease [Pseudanabaenaceae cyanobacterium bins.68]
MISQFQTAFTLFLSLLVEAVPFLLLGVLLSSLLLIFVDEQQLLARIPRQPLLASLCGSLLGFLFPVCECGNVPVARRLIGKGAPPAMAVGFLLAAPTINPIVIWATWTAFRDQPEIVVLRVVFSLAIATIIGAIFGLQGDLRGFLKPGVIMPLQTYTGSVKLPPTGTFWLGSGSQPLALPRVSPVQVLLNNMVGEFRELGGVLVLGSAIAAVIQVWVPRDLILTLGQGPVSSIIAMMILAAVVSICSTVDAFFALSFAATFTSGSLLAFLVFGPMIDLKAIGLMLTIFQRRAIFYLFAIAAQLTFLFCLFLNLQVR